MRPSTQAHSRSGGRGRYTEIVSNWPAGEHVKMLERARAERPNLKAATDEDVTRLRDLVGAACVHESAEYLAAARSAAYVEKMLENRRRRLVLLARVQPHARRFDQGAPRCALATGTARGQREAGDGESRMERDEGA